ncbi:hypothetical protein UlMin_011641 [Ulmus minor]
MAEEFEAGICGGNWWGSSRSVLAAASPCSLGINDIGSFGWAANDVMDIKASSSSGETNNSISDSSIVFQEVQKPHAQTDSTAGTILIDSSLQMMGFGLSTSPTSDLNNQAFVNRGRVDNNYYSMLQEDSTQIQKEWSPKNFDALTNGFKPNQDPNLDQVSGSCAAISQGFSTGYPMSSASYGYSASTLLQTLFDGETQPPQQSFCNNRSLNNYSSSTPNFGSNSSTTMSPNCWPRFSPFPRPSLPKQQQPCSFWNGPPAGTNLEARAGLFGSPQLQYLTPTTFEEKLTTKANSNEDVKDSGSAVKKSTGSEPVLKRPRIETPSPLPTFKVRKEKLGDRITALQQLVSPFGKTDTASVLHEAIEYIKFLHDQVSVLSTPYMKNGAPIQNQKGSDKLKDPECPKQDLNSRGLCLVPISSTFPVANETTADFWTPTFGGSFR